MWLVNYFHEWKVWRTIKRVFKENKSEFDKVGLKCDYFGRLYKVINRDPSIPIGSERDGELLQDELREISDTLIKMNIMDLLAYDLIPQEENNDEYFENAYLVKLTPTWKLDKQYCTMFSSTILGLGSLGILGGLIYLLFFVIL